MESIIPRPRFAARQQTGIQQVLSEDSSGESAGSVNLNVGIVVPEFLQIAPNLPVLVKDVRLPGKRFDQRTHVVSAEGVSIQRQWQQNDRDSVTSSQVEHRL